MQREMSYFLGRREQEFLDVINPQGFYYGGHACIGFVFSDEEKIARRVKDSSGTYIILLQDSPSDSVSVREAREKLKGLADKF